MTMKHFSSVLFIALACLAAWLGLTPLASAQTLPKLVLNTMANQTLQLSWSAPTTINTQALHVISWNIGDDNIISGAGESAGIINAPYWNNTQLINGNVTGNPVNDSNLVDNNGAATTMAIAQNSSQNTYNFWAINFATPPQDADGTYNRRMLNGYQNKGATEAPYTSSVTISGVPYATYDVYVYFSSDTAGRTGCVSDGSLTYYFSTLGPAATAGTNALLVQTTELNSANNPGADYAIFPGLTSSRLTISVTIPNYGGIAAIQVVQSSKALNFALQETSDLTDPTSWQPSALAVASQGGNLFASVPVTNLARFFRLASTPAFVFSNDYVSNGLVAYWKMNDGAGSTALDASGNQNNLALFGSPVWGSNYLNLNGSTQYGDAGSNYVAALDQQDKTICAWINKTGSSQKGIVDKSFNTPNVGYGGWGFWVQSNQSLMWITVDSQPFYDTGASGIALGSWTFVTVVWNYSIQRADFYINGILNSSVGNGAASEFPSATADLQVGNLRNNLSGGSYAFDGSMRDVGIYNRALSPAEIQTNFLNTESNTNVAIPDLLYYKMTEQAQSNPPAYLADSSTHGGTTGTMFAINTVQWETNVASIPGTSLHFNGTATYIDTSNTTLFNFTTNLFTINLWLMPLTANGYVMQNQTPLQNGWFLNVGGSYSLNFGSDNNGTETAVSTGAGAVINGLFTMVTIVRTGPTNVLIYINGDQVATTGSFASPASSPNSLILGVDQAGDHHLDGNIWLTQIWSTPLSPTDISNLYFNQVTGVPWP
jgi:hypothetical protein